MGSYWAEIADADQTERQFSFLKSQLSPCGYVLDLACGTGRHTIPLWAAGFGMVGLDVSKKLLRIAKQRDRSVQVVCGDIRFLPFKAEAFDAVVSMDTSIGYLPKPKDDEAAFVEAHRVLGVGGVFIVDVFNQSHLASKYWGKRSTSKLFEYPSFRLQQQRSVSSDCKRLSDVWTVRNKEDGEGAVFEHAVRLYTKEQLEGMLGAAGFAVKDVFGAYECQGWGADLPRLIIKAAAK